MPIFEFKCLDCGHLFEHIFKHVDEKVEMRCPECKSPSFERVLSRTSHVMKPGTGDPKTTLTTKSCAGGNSCCTLDIPGPTK